VKLGRKSSLIAVTVHVARALADAGIRAVLTGGACANLHTGGRTRSFDLDFVLQGSVPPRKLDEAMAAAGFTRKGNQYHHPSVRFVVEFPPGPLGIGADCRLRPGQHNNPRASVRARYPMDSCRDRLAGFYHWNDRQSLKAAVAIARRHHLGLRVIQRWSARVGFLPAFEEFAAEVGKSGIAARRKT
jgi:hypothetical protein